MPNAPSVKNRVLAKEIVMFGVHWFRQTSRFRRDIHLLFAVVLLAGLALGARLGGGVAGAQTATTLFSHGFETDNSGWNVLPGDNTATRVASGSHSVVSHTGGFHAEVPGPFPLGPTNGSAFTRWGSVCNVFPPGGYTTRVDV